MGMLDDRKMEDCRQAARIACRESRRLIDETRLAVAQSHRIIDEAQRLIKDSKRISGP